MLDNHDYESCRSFRFAGCTGHAMFKSFTNHTNEASWQGIKYDIVRQVKQISTIVSCIVYIFKYSNVPNSLCLTEESENADATICIKRCL